MAKDETRSAADWFDDGLICFHQPDGIGAVQAFEAVIEIGAYKRHINKVLSIIHCRFIHAATFKMSNISCISD